jgi:hypothetical protein
MLPSPWQFTDINGNYLVLDINVDKINFTLVSIYGPNDDNPQFYENNVALLFF